MRFEVHGKRPQVDTSATVAPTAVISGDVTVGPGAHVEAGAEVRIHGVVHVNTRVPAGATVPIGWVAVGDPASILPPDEHDRIWAIQKTLDFPGTVYGVPRDAQGSVDMAEVTRRAARRDHPGWTPLD